MTPGSDHARMMGCICCSVANRAGVGSEVAPIDASSGVQYVVSTNCPMHGFAKWGGHTYTARYPDAIWLGGTDLVLGRTEP